VNTITTHSTKGKRAFSFKGQTVEYCFKPDGTWDTIPIANPPDDGPRYAANTKKEHPEKRSVPVLAEPQEATGGISWWWHGIGGAALLTAFAWFWPRKG
jgi:hypothetical protein